MGVFVVRILMHVVSPSERVFVGDAHFCHATFRFGTGAFDWFRGALKLGYLLVDVS